MRLSSVLQRAALLGALLSLAACATRPPPPMYAWGGYEASMVKYYKSEGDIGTQVQLLEQQLQKNAGAHRATPPGLHGHLALLYTKMGDQAGAQRHLEAERELFPESAAYINFLLKRPMAAAPAASAASAAV